MRLLQVDRGMLEAKTHEVRRGRRTDFTKDDREKSRRNAAVVGDILHRYAGPRHPLDHDVFGVVAKLLVTARAFVKTPFAVALHEGRTQKAKKSVAGVPRVARIERVERRAQEDHDVLEKPPEGLAELDRVRKIRERRRTRVSTEIVGGHRHGKPLALRAGNENEGHRRIPNENGVARKGHRSVLFLEEGFPSNQKEKLNILLGLHRGDASEGGGGNFAVNESPHGALRRPNGKRKGRVLRNGTDFRIEAVS